MEDTLPPLPTPAYGWIEDYYDGWSYIENPKERWCELNLFTEEQMREYARQAVLAERAARDQAAFRAGWMTAANWMDRDDLLADIGSPAYLKDMADSLAAIRKGE